jgi:hypothetical protein
MSDLFYQLDTGNNYFQYLANILKVTSQELEVITYSV